MVPELDDAIMQGPYTATPDRGLANVSRGEDSPAPDQWEPLLGSLEAIRCRTEAPGISGAAAKLLEQSRRPGTRAVYGSAWEKWISWCVARRADPFRAHIELVLNFLSAMKEEGLGYNTLNGYRSAISAYHLGFNNTPVGQHALIKRLMAGVHNICPPTPKYSSTWDVEVVLNHLERLGSDELLDDAQLSHKLAMLLAITTAGRASELQGLSLDYMADRGSNISFSLAKLTKTCRPGKKCKEIIIHEFTDRPRLDPVKCLRQYILRTVGWRQTEKQHSLLLGIVALTTQ